MKHFVRSYTQELINQAIASEFTFSSSYLSFKDQMPKTQDVYLEWAQVLTEAISKVDAHVDGSAIIWALIYNDYRLLYDAARECNRLFIKILSGKEVSFEELFDKNGVFYKAGLSINSIYGRDGYYSNVKGKWDIITYGPNKRYTFTVGKTANTGTLCIFKPGRGGDYQSDDFAYSKVVSIAPSELKANFEDDVNLYFEIEGTPVEDTNCYKYTDVKIIQSPYVYQEVYAYKPIPGEIYYIKSGDLYIKVSDNPGTEVLSDFDPDVTYYKRVVVDSVSTYIYDPDYEWEQMLKDSAFIKTNIQLDKIWRGWFGTGKAGWSLDINDLPYTQTLDDHDYTKRYITEVKKFNELVHAVRAEDLLSVITYGDAVKLYKIGNLWAIRHALFNILHRQLDVIRKKGLR